MNGRTSKLANKIYDKYQKRYLRKMRKGKLIGTKFKIDGKTYIITDGNLNINISKFKKDIIKKYKL